ncbi:MAG: polysaccharide biosynthesis C-terminal domain-containing protein [Rhodococcus sp.]|nr:polysaccharide biosynthesis C-terminal domain-containing protein [Rhodococcus sp. (in: high G+C Gram-positive bacteria)]
MNSEVATARSGVTGVIAATALAGGLAFLCNLVLFWREMLTASIFGIGAALDGFIVASLLPVFVAALLSGAVAPALATALAGWRHAGGADEARSRLAQIHLTLLAGTCVLVAVMWVLGFIILEPLYRGSTPAVRADILALYRLLLPLVVLQVSSAVWKLVLNMQRRIMLAAMTPALAPLCSVLLLAGDFPARHGVVVLAWGLLAGASLEWMLLARAAWASHAWHDRNAIARPAHAWLRGYATLVGAALFTTSAWFVDNAMAATLAAGSVAALGFGSKVVSFGVGIVATGISTALLPAASELVSARRWPALQGLALRYGLVLLATSLPLTLAIVVWSTDIVSLLFERGRFDADATRLVTDVQAALAVQVPLHILGVLCVRILAALGENRVVLAIAVAGTLLNVALNWLLMRQWGVVGIAWATSAMFTLTGLAAACALWRVLARRFHVERRESLA